MKRTPDLARVAKADVQLPQRVVLKGQFTEVMRSAKGKVKGLYLRAEAETYAIKLPKYLRPMLVRELSPGAFVQVWADFDEEKWRGINVLPLSEQEAIALQKSWQTPTARHTDATVATVEPSLKAAKSSPPSSKKLCVKVCRKGKCFKQGGRQIIQSLETAIATDPNLQHVSVEGVGCLKACKKGPNLKLSNSPKVINGVTPSNVIDIVTRYA
ncbi:MAG: (2Fe-2S) ferredoxin domain-containing protein [Cyanobacteria bacterium P01_D01_bin.6]